MGVDGGTVRKTEALSVVLLLELADHFNVSFRFRVHLGKVPAGLVFH